MSQLQIEPNHLMNQISIPTLRTAAILSHLGGFFTSWLAPLIILLINKDEINGEFAARNAREALNFQLTLMLAYVVCFILSFILIGLFLFWVVTIGNLIFSIVAAIKASNGSAYRYPMTIRFVR